MKHWIPALLVTLWSGQALAASAETTADALRGATVCFPAKGVPDLIAKLAELEPDRRDVVDITLEPRFIIKDGGVWPERFYLAADGAHVADIPFSRDTGETPSFLESVAIRPDTDICVDDPTRADRPEGYEGLYFEMGLSPLFHNATGTHTLAELEEGAKDGKKFYKKMLPGAMAMFMPDTDYFAVKMIDQTVVPTVAALTTLGEMPLHLESVKDLWVVSLDDMKEIEATDVIIRGGAYELQPVPSPKTLRQFGLGDTIDDN